MAAAIRPEVALLVAEARAGGVVVFSPAGPLTRSELELVEGPGDPLAAGRAAYPTGRSRWATAGRSSDAAARSLAAYDTLTANKLEATLESVDAARPGSGSGARSGARCSGAKGRWRATARTRSTARRGGSPR